MPLKETVELNQTASKTTTEAVKASFAEYDSLASLAINVYSDRACVLVRVSFAFLARGSACASVARVAVVAVVRVRVAAVRCVFADRGVAKVDDVTSIFLPVLDGTCNGVSHMRSNIRSKR